MVSMYSGEGVRSGDQVVADRIFLGMNRLSAERKGEGTLFPSRKSSRTEPSTHLCCLRALQAPSNALGQLGGNHQAK